MIYYYTHQLLLPMQEWNSSARLGPGRAVRPNPGADAHTGPSPAGPHLRPAPDRAGPLTPWPAPRHPESTAGAGRRGRGLRGDATRWPRGRLPGMCVRSMRPPAARVTSARSVRTRRRRSRDLQKRPGGGAARRGDGADRTRGREAVLCSGPPPSGRSQAWEVAVPLGKLKGTGSACPSRDTCECKALTERSECKS